MRTRHDRTIFKLSIRAALLLATASPLSAEHPVEKYAWYFPNFRSEPCLNEPGIDFYGWDRYRESYIGIPPESQASPFDDLFYNEIYKVKLGVAGNCYGMILMSLLINDKGGHLGYCAPVGAYSGDLVGKAEAPDGTPEPIPPHLHTCNEDPDENETKTTGPTDPLLRRALEEMMGHQIHLPSVSYTLEQFGKPGGVDADEAWDLVDFHGQCILNITKFGGFETFSEGHTILAYDATDHGDHKKIWVYDPNRSWGIQSDREWYTGAGLDTPEPGDDTQPANFVRIEGKDWEFDMGGDGMWPAGDGMIIAIPLSIAGPKARNPASLEGQIPNLLSKILVFGSDSGLTQVTDPDGKRLFIPGTKRLEIDPEFGLLDTMPFIPSDGLPGVRDSSHTESYFMLGEDGGARNYQIRGNRSGYEMKLASRRSTLIVKALGGRGSDVVRVEHFGTRVPIVTLFNKTGASRLEVELIQTITGVEGARFRSFKLTDMTMRRDGLVEIQVKSDQKGILVTSPVGEVSFDLELGDRNGDEEETAKLEEIAVVPGATGFIGVEDWSNLAEADVVGGAEQLTPGELEYYYNQVYGASSGPIGEHFENARDIGSATGGSTLHDTRSDSYAQVAYGTGVGEGEDSFHFAYTPVVGDFEFTVEVLPNAAGGPVGTYGLMSRRDLTPESRHSHLWKSASDGAGGGGGQGWSYRPVDGEAESFDSSQSYAIDPEMPTRFLKLVRRQNTFYGYASRDGKIWQPVGTDTWHDQFPGVPVFVGFASASGSPNARSIVQFKVHQLGDIDPSLEPFVHDDGISSGDVLFATEFEGRDGERPAEFLVQRGAGKFTPTIVDGRLRLSDARFPGSSTSAFSEFRIENIEEAVYQFDFDLFLTAPKGVASGDGVTFVILGGDDPTQVGSSGDGLGYDGLGRDPRTGANRSHSSFGVELDQWDGGSVHNEGAGSPEEPGKYHVGIDVQNHVASVVQASEELPDAFAPRGVHVTVLYNRGRVIVFLGSDPKSMRRVVDADLLPLSFPSRNSEAVVGFTAATGEATQTAEVDNLVVSVVRCDDVQEIAEITGAPEEPVGIGERVILDGSASHGGPGDEVSEPVSYQWELVSGRAEIEGPDFGPTVNVIANAEGEVTVRLTVDDGHCDNPASTEISFEVGVEVPKKFLRGDCNGDGDTSGVDDAVTMLFANFVRRVPVPCRSACDANADGDTGGTADAILMLTLNFLGGDPPEHPYPSCARSDLPSDLELGCDETPAGCR